MFKRPRKYLQKFRFMKNFAVVFLEKISFLEQFWHNCKTSTLIFLSVSYASYHFIDFLRWNATFIDYSSHILPMDVNYKFKHYSSSLGGHLVTVDSSIGKSCKTFLVFILIFFVDVFFILLYFIGLNRFSLKMSLYICVRDLLLTAQPEAL